MKTIMTNLSEQQFLHRLDSMCTTHKMFDNGYEDKNTFVVKRKQQRFRMGWHLSMVGNSDGYASEFIFGEYRVNEFGMVELRYRFGMPFMFAFPFAMICIIAFPIFLCLLCDGVFHGGYQWGGLCVTLLFTIVGFVILLARPKKIRLALEEHLHRICFPQK